MLSHSTLKAWGLSEGDIANLVAEGYNRKYSKLSNLVMGLYQQTKQAEAVARHAQKELRNCELELTLVKYHTASLYLLIGSMTLFYIVAKRS